MSAEPARAEACCILCGAEPTPEAYWTREIVRCACGLVYTDQRRAKTPDELYGKAFFEGQDAYHDYQAERAVLQRNFQNHLDVLARYQPSGRLLEIGCAFGFCLELAQQRWQASGIDISAHAVEQARARGVQAVAASYLEHALPADSLDVICMWDTIEHLDRPDLFLRKAARELKPGGVLALTTGDIGSLNARLRGRKWRLVHPTHFFYFSRATMTRLLAAAGLAPVRYTTTVHWRSVKNIANQVGANSGSGPLQKALFALRDSPLGWLHVPMNLHDIMFVVARKS